MRAIASTLLMGAFAPAYGQQFNSDNWWVLPHGVVQGVATEGQNYSSMYLGYGLAPNWEVDIASTLFEGSGDESTDYFSTTAYVKRLLFEGEEKTSGLSAMVGIGSTPGYLQSNAVTRDLTSYWAYFPWTLSFYDNTLAWDIMPGAAFNTEYGQDTDTAWGALYSTRAALYGVVPSSAIVAEVFGSEGEAYSKPQYKVGVRFESKYFICALTYGAAFDGDEGGGIEFGIIGLSPSYFGTY